MRRLVCRFVVCKQQSQGYRCRGQYDVEAETSWPLWFRAWVLSFNATITSGIPVGLLAKVTIYYLVVIPWAVCMYVEMSFNATVLPAKSGIDIMFCLQSYQGLRIDRSLVY